MRSLRRVRVAFLLSVIVVACLGVFVWLVTNARASWEQKPPTADGWLTFAGAALGTLLAVLGAFIVGQGSVRREAQLALQNALAVWDKDRVAQMADRAADRIDRDRLQFRPALVELLDACRQWQACDPFRGDFVAARLQVSTLELPKVEALLGNTHLPGELLRYLLWSLWYVRLTNDGFQESLRLKLQGISGAQIDRNRWWAVIDRLQVIACLLTAEAKQRGLTDLALAFEHEPWFRPLPGAEHERENTEREHPARFGAPPWPGEGAYSLCSPARRDGTPDEPVHYTDLGLTPEI